MLNNVPSVQDTSVLSPGLHIGLILTLAFIIFKKSSSHLFEHHPCLYLLAFGMVISKISNKLVVRSFCLTVVMLIWQCVVTLVTASTVAITR